MKKCGVLFLLIFCANSFAVEGQTAQTSVRSPQQDADIAEAKDLLRQASTLASHINLAGSKPGSDTRTTELVRQIVHAQAMADDIDGALKTASVFPEKSGKPLEQKTIALALAKAGRVSEALGISSVSALATSGIDSIMEALLKGGYTSSVFAALTDLPTNEGKIILLARIARAQTKAGDSAAQQTFQQALHLATSTIDFARIAKAQHEAGDQAAMAKTFQSATEKILSSKPKIRTPHDKSTVEGLVIIATAQAYLGDKTASEQTLKLALEDASSLYKGETAIGALDLIAQVQASAGNSRGSTDTFRKCLELADTLPEDGRWYPLTRIAQDQIYAEQFTAVPETLQRAIQSVKVSTKSLDVTKNDLEKLKKMRTGVLEAIALIAAVAGQGEMALDIAESVDLVSTKVKTFSHIVNAVHKVKRMQNPSKVLLRLSRGINRVADDSGIQDAKDLINVAVVQAGIDELPLAVATIEKIREPKSWPDAYNFILRILIEANNWAGARQIADRLPNDYYSKPDLLKKLVKRQATTSGVNDMRDWCLRQNAALLQASCLLGTAEGILERSEVEVLVENPLKRFGLAD